MIGLRAADIVALRRCDDCLIDERVAMLLGVDAPAIDRHVVNFKRQA